MARSYVLAWNAEFSFHGSSDSFKVTLYDEGKFKSKLIGEAVIDLRVLTNETNCTLDCRSLTCSYPSQFDQSLSSELQLRGADSERYVCEKEEEQEPVLHRVFRLLCFALFRFVVH